MGDIEAMLYAGITCLTMSLIFVALVRKTTMKNDKKKALFHKTPPRTSVEPRAKGGGSRTFKIPYLKDLDLIADQNHRSTTDVLKMMIEYSMDTIFVQHSRDKKDPIYTDNGTYKQLREYEGRCDLERHSMVNLSMEILARLIEENILEELLDHIITGNKEVSVAGEVSRAVQEYIRREEGKK